MMMMMVIVKTMVKTGLTVLFDLHAMQQKQCNNNTLACFKRHGVRDVSRDVDCIEFRALQLV